MRSKRGRMQRFIGTILAAGMLLLVSSNIEPMQVQAATAQSSSVQQPTVKDSIGLKQESQIVAIGKKISIAQDTRSKKVTYKSSKTEIATVDSKGTVTGVARGKSVITISDGKTVTKVPVTVYEQRLSTKQTELTLSQEGTIRISLARRSAAEELTLIVADPNIVQAKAIQWTKDTCIVQLTPKQDGKTTLMVKRPKSVEPLVIQLDVKQKKVLSATELYAKCEASMVDITTRLIDGNQVTGSGFFIGEGQVLTNYHVIQGAISIDVKDYHGNQFEVTGYYGYNDEFDLALLQVKGSKEALPINFDEMVTGDMIYTIGSPYGFSGSFSKGIVSYVGRQVNDSIVRYTQHTAAISKGNSGGPLINCYGEVVGVNTLTYLSGQNINFSVPMVYSTFIDQSSVTPIQKYYDQSRPE